MFRNTPDSFGLVTRALHWGIAGVILIQLPLGLRLGDMQPGLSNLWLYGLHKTLGLTLFALILARILWHLISPPPAPIGGGWPARLARLTHWAIYGLMILIPLSGWAASSATGIDTLFLNRWAVPAIAPVSERIEHLGFALHAIAAKALLALVALHVMGALKREMEGDGTLRRMIRGRA